LSRHPRQPRGRRAVTPPEAELPLPAVAVAADVSKD
jgi:hypothetical protein